MLMDGMLGWELLACLIMFLVFKGHNLAKCQFLLSPIQLLAENTEIVIESHRSYLKETAMGVK
jgi:hypothetical protein